MNKQSEVLKTLSLVILLQDGMLTCKIKTARDWIHVLSVKPLNNARQMEVFSLECVSC